MVRKQTFSLEDVVQAGFRVVDAEGWGQLTARNVAEALGSSTAPVYSNFANMSHLAAAVVKEATRVFMEETRKPRSGDPFLDIGLGVLYFAREHPRWYEALFREMEADPQVNLGVTEDIIASMASMPDLKDLSEAERIIVLRKMAIFTHGMASELCTQGPDHLSMEEMRVLMDEVGDAVVKDALQRPDRSPEEIELLGSFPNCCQARQRAKKEDENE